MHPEFVYNQFAKIKFLLDFVLQKTKLKNKNIDLYGGRIKVLIQLISAIDDALIFYNISKEEFFNHIESWENLEKKLFQQASSLREFYESWSDEVALKNVCANVVNQMIWYENYNVCAAYASEANYVIDYGCGTGTLSLALKLDEIIKNKLVLLDVPNDVFKFREFRIAKNCLKNVYQDNIFTYNSPELADLIICLDVLEHIEESSLVFIDKICPMIKVGGHIILRAPWRGQLTHIDEAADNFYLGGGRKYLSEYFKEVYRFGFGDICCVYKKIK